VGCELRCANLWLGKLLLLVFRLLTAQICHAFNGLDSPLCHASIELLVVQAQSDSLASAEHFHQAGATVAQSGGNLNNSFGKKKYLAFHPSEFKDFNIGFYQIYMMLCKSI